MSSSREVKKVMPKLTKTLVENATVPQSGDAFIWDTEVPGFGLRIQASGRKVYVVRYRTNDAQRTQRKMNIGRASDMAPEKARGMARDVFAKVAGGEDPASERKPKAKAGSPVTLKAMFEGYVADMRSKSKASAAEVERVLVGCKHNAADFIGADKEPVEVTAQDIVDYVSTYYDAGHRGAADKARGYINAAFNWAIKSANDYTVKVRVNWGVKHNPAAEVAKDHGAIGVRDRNLDAAEIRIAWKACHDGNAGFSLETEICLLTILACGQRVQETLRMCGSEVDLDDQLWKMPAHKTKGKKFPHDVPLPGVIIPYLRKLKDKYGDGPLFPGRADAEDGLLTSVSVAHAVRKWVKGKDSPIEPFQPRDLRRTWKSRSHDAGIDRFTRDLIQQHAKSDTGSKHYDRAIYLPQMREAMDKWSSWLGIVLAGGTPPAYGEPLVKVAA